MPAGAGAALYRALARVEQRLGVDRMSRALDRQFDWMLPPEVAALIKEAGYGFEAIPAAWAGVMDRCRPEMLAEVTCPVLLVKGQFDQLGVDARRYARAAASAPWVRVVTVRHGLHVFPLTHPHDTAAALWELVSAARRHAARAVRRRDADGAADRRDEGDGIRAPREGLGEPTPGLEGPGEAAGGPARGVERAVVDRQHVAGARAGGRLRCLGRAEVARGQARAPAPDREQREVDGAPGELGEAGHVVVERGVAGEPHDDPAAAHEHARRAVGAVRHRACVVVGAHEEHLDPGGDGTQSCWRRLEHPEPLPLEPRGVVGVAQRPARGRAAAATAGRRGRGGGGSTSTASTSSTWRCTGTSARWRSMPSRDRRRGSVRMRTPPRSRTSAEWPSHVARTPVAPEGRRSGRPGTPPR